MEPRVIEAAARAKQSESSTMYNQLKSVCAFPLTDIARARVSVEKRQFMVASQIGGLVDLSPHRTGLVPANVWRMPVRDLLLVGTACPRPALLNEAADIAANVAHDMLIVRDEFDMPFGYRTSFDVRLDDEKRWRCGYYLWQAEDERTWLLPDGDRPGGLRVCPIGFVVKDCVPYGNEAERRDGFDRANDTLDTIARRR